MTEPAIISIAKPLSIITTKEINSMWTADLEILKDDYIAAECYIELKNENELYIVRDVEKIINKGKITFNNYLEHNMSELNDFEVEPFDLTDTATNILTSFLAGTGWSVGTVNVAGSKQVVSTKRITVLAAIRLMIDQFGGELDWHSKTRVVDFKTQIGSNNGVQIRYDENATYISRRENSRYLVTRLYIYGKDGLTIEAINPTGFKYIDSAHINDYKHPKIYTEYKSDIDDATELYNYALTRLAELEVIQYQYRASTFDMTVRPAWANKIINLGDTVKVYNYDLNINVNCRVFRIARDLLDPLNFIIDFESTLPNISENVSTIREDLDDIKEQTTVNILKPPIFVFEIPGCLAIDDKPCVPLSIPYNISILEVYLYVDTPSDGTSNNDDIIVDIMMADKNGDNEVSIFPNPSERPRIPYDHHYGNVWNGDFNHQWIKNKVVYPKIIQVGEEETPGADLVIELRGCTT